MRLKSLMGAQILRNIKCHLSQWEEIKGFEYKVIIEGNIQNKSLNRPNSTSVKVL